MTCTTVNERRTSGRTTQTDSRSQRTRASRKGRHRISRARSPSSKPACPTTFSTQESPVPGDPLVRGRSGDSCGKDFHAPNLRSGRDGDEQTSVRPRLRQRTRRAACRPTAGRLTPAEVAVLLRSACSPVDARRLANGRPAWRCAPFVGEHQPRRRRGSLAQRKTRDSAGRDCRILAMRKYGCWPGGCRPSLRPAALPVAEQSSHADAVTGVGVDQQRRPGRGCRREPRRVTRAASSGPTVSGSDRAGICSRVRRRRSVARRAGARSTTCWTRAIKAQLETRSRSAGSNRKRWAHPVAGSWLPLSSLAMAIRRDDRGVHRRLGSRDRARGTMSECRSPVHRPGLRAAFVWGSGLKAVARL